MIKLFDKHLVGLNQPFIVMILGHWRRSLLVLLALLIAAMPLLNESLASSHDPLVDVAANHEGQDRNVDLPHTHEDVDTAMPVHSLDDGHGYGHNAGDHTHETAFVPLSTGGVQSPTGVQERTPYLTASSHGWPARLERPPKRLAA